uniref:Coat protein n=1 Tax=Leviviridae sp. TaxID=2027243 RepID=A0A514CYX4_9VIRU|nr:MAG: hypothetical protein H1BulkLitter5580_000002 [Leviviridae sp.]
MLPTNLTTNEVKDAAGAEIEFLRIGTEGRKVVFAKSGEAPNAPHRITVQHTEIGTGVALRRRSNIRVDKTVTGVSLAPRVVTFSATLDAPVGDLSADTEIKAVIANMVSFLASLGASTTILYDCTGNGAASLVQGSL